MTSKLRAANEDKSSAPARASQGFRVGANHDRHGEDLRIMGGQFNLLLSGDDSGGGLLIYDTPRWQKGGPALHKHYSQDEWFYVLRGEFVVRVGEETLALRPGDSAFASRQVPHAFAMTSEGEGQMLVLFQLAGSMEHFFREISKLGPAIPQKPGDYAKKTLGRSRYGNRGSAVEDLSSRRPESVSEIVPAT